MVWPKEPPAPVAAADTSPHDTRWWRSDVVVLLILLIMATLLRAPGLAPPSLWLDDVWVALVSKVDDPALVLRMGVTAPGFSSLQNLVFAVLGFSELSAQLLPFAAAVAAPPTVYVVMRRWGMSPYGSSLAGLVLVLAPIHVTFSTSAKQFSIDVLLGLVLLHLAWRASQQPSSDRVAAAAGVAVTATVISASVAPIAATVLTISFALGLAPDRRRLLMWPIAAGVLLAGYTVLIANWTPQVLGEFWSDELSTGVLDGPAAAWRVLEGFLGVRLLAVAAAAWIVAGLARSSLLLRMLLVGPVLVAIGVSYLGVPLGTGRTDQYLYGPLAIAIGLPLETVAREIWMRASAIVLVGVVMAIPRPLPGYADPNSAMQQRDRQHIEEAAEALTEDGQLVTVGTTFAVGLYGPWEVEIFDAPSSTTGWWPIVDDRRVVNVAGWPSTPAALRSGFPDLSARRVEVVLTHFGYDIIDEVKIIMHERGYRLRNETGRSGSWWGSFEIP